MHLGRGSSADRAIDPRRNWFGCVAHDARGLATTGDSYDRWSVVCRRCLRHDRTADGAGDDDGDRRGNSGRRFSLYPCRLCSYVRIAIGISFAMAPPIRDDHPPHRVARQPAATSSAIGHAVASAAILARTRRVDIAQRLSDYADCPNLAELGQEKASGETKVSVETGDQIVAASSGDQDG